MTGTAHQLVEAVGNILPLPGIASVIHHVLDGHIGIRTEWGLTAHLPCRLCDAERFVIGSIVTECARRGWTAHAMNGMHSYVGISWPEHDGLMREAVTVDGTSALAWCEAFRRAKEATDAG